MIIRHFVALVILVALCASANAQCRLQCTSDAMFARLDGEQENPDVVTPATGFGRAVYNSVPNTLAVDLSWSGLLSNTNNAHIHCCATMLTTNAGVAIDFPSVGFPLGVTAGTFMHTFDLGNTATYTSGFLSASGGTANGSRDRLVNAMLFGVANDPLPGDSSIAYFNIHTVNNGGGEIRGNIRPIPEPTSVLLVLCSLAAFALAQRTR